MRHDTLAFLHTAQVHVATFSALARKLDGSVPVRHEVREDLLAVALADGGSSAVLSSAVCDALQELARDGARVIVCTCSTIGASAEAAVVPDCTVLRVDRPVATDAVASGRRIVVVAALPTALQQTLALLREVASAAQRSPLITHALCARAWGYFERGDTPGYLAQVADTIRSTAVAEDVVLLAQASMAPVAELVARPDISILSSPISGVKAALAAFRGKAPVSLTQ